MADQSSRLNRELRRLQRNINNAARSNRFQIIALKEVEGLMKRRIFNDGLDSNNKKIGNYSTKPMLVGASSFIFKSGARKFLGSKKARRKRTWVTLPGGRRVAVLTRGYKQLRELQGRQTAFVDLEFTSDLRNGIQVGKTSAGNNALGILTDKQSEKAAGNEARFNTEIFAISRKEQRAMDRAILKEFERILGLSFR